MSGDTFETNEEKIYRIGETLSEMIYDLVEEQSKESSYSSYVDADGDELSFQTLCTLETAMGLDFLTNASRKEMRRDFENALSEIRSEIRSENPPTARDRRFMCQLWESGESFDPEYDLYGDSIAEEMKNWLEENPVSLNVSIDIKDNECDIIFNVDKELPQMICFLDAEKLSSFETQRDISAFCEDFIGGLGKEEQKNQPAPC